MRNFFSVILSVVLFFGCFGAQASAKETVYPMALHTYVSTAEFASDEWTVTQRGAYLLDGTSSIARQSSSMINISGCTNATRVCDKVELTLYVERSKSYATGYSTYKYYSYSADDVYQLVKEISNIPIVRGYYYRVAAVHSVTEGSTMETTDSVTDPIDFR